MEERHQSGWSDRPATPAERKGLERWVRVLWLANFIFGAYLVIKGVSSGKTGFVILELVLGLIGAFFVVGMRSGGSGSSDD